MASSYNQELEHFIDGLMSQFSRNNKDVIGPDPFHLRECAPSTLSQQAEFADMLEECDKTQLPAISTNSITGHMPKRMHFIWLGSALTNELHRKALTNWKILNPDYDVTLYTDITNFDDDQNAEMLMWCKENKIHLVNADEVFASDDVLFKAYKNEQIKRNYGAASDLLRWIILLRFLGMYGDLDNITRTPISDSQINSELEFFINSGERYFVDGHPYDRQSAPAKFKAFNNDLICMLRTGEFTAYIAECLAKKYLQEFSLDPKNLRATTEDDFKKIYTIKTSGPSMLHEAIAQYQPNLDFDKLAVPFANDMVFGSELSWMKDNLQQTDPETETKRVFTSIVDDLSRRNKNLLMLNQAKNLSCDQLKFVLQLIKEYYPNLWGNIKAIKPPNQDWLAHNIEFYEMMAELDLSANLLAPALVISIQDALNNQQHDNAQRLINFAHSQLIKNSSNATDLEADIFALENLYSFFNQSKLDAITLENFTDVELEKFVKIKDDIEIKINTMTEQWIAENIQMLENPHIRNKEKIVDDTIDLICKYCTDVELLTNYACVILNNKLHTPTSTTSYNLYSYFTLTTHKELKESFSAMLKSIEMLMAELPRDEMEKLEVKQQFVEQVKVLEEISNHKFTKHLHMSPK